MMPDPCREGLGAGQPVSDRAGSAGTSWPTLPSSTFSSPLHHRKSDRRGDPEKEQAESEDEVHLDGSTYCLNSYAYCNRDGQNGGDDADLRQEQGTAGPVKRPPAARVAGHPGSMPATRRMRPREPSVWPGSSERSDTTRTPRHQPDGYLHFSSAAPTECLAP